MTQKTYAVFAVDRKVGETSIEFLPADSPAEALLRHSLVIARPPTREAHGLNAYDTSMALLDHGMMTHVEEMPVSPEPDSDYWTLVQRMRNVADDNEEDVIDELLVRADIYWKCTCGQHNTVSEDAVCDDCGAVRVT
jgi:hypothetical protein